MNISRVHQIEISSRCNLACSYCPHPGLQRVKGDMDWMTASRQACDEGADWLERLNRETEALYRERELADAKVDHAVRLLNGIHALLYPAPFTAQDGRTMVFRPKSIDPHDVLQELSDRIRDLPDEISKAGLARPNG